MSKITSEKEQLLPKVRRLEAAGFRAWPAASTHYDGSWLVRLTAGHPAKRLNSVNPLDPSDGSNLSARLAKAARRFNAYNRPLTVRVSPLAGSHIQKLLDEEGWETLSESAVMAADISTLPIGDAIDQIPMKDIGRFVEALISVRNFDKSIKAGLSEVIESIQPETGLFVFKNGDKPVSTTICVHDGELAGLFEIATQQDYLRQGHAKNIILAALRWANMLGARRAWLQVEVENTAAMELYCSLGFAEVYRYHYRQKLG